MIDSSHKNELLMLARETSLKEDMRHVAAGRHNPVLLNGTADMDRLIRFLQGFNEFMNHKPKEFRPIPDHKMKL